MRLISQLCGHIFSAALYLPFMIGQYAPGAMLFAAPVDFASPSLSIVRSPTTRAQALSAGSDFVWCTLAALADSPLCDPAARAALSCRMFQAPHSKPLDVPPSAAVEFSFGVTKLRSLQQRPDPDHPPARARLSALCALLPSRTPPSLNGQGATSRKLEPDRWRRTTEGGGPRQATFDAGGVRALSLNEAARIYHMPEHFIADRRGPFLEWLRLRGLPRDNPIPPSDGRP